MPAPARPGRRARVLEEGEVGARAALLVRVEEVVDGRIVLVDGLLHQAQAEHARVEVDVAGGVARDGGDVVDPLEPHARRLPPASLAAKGGPAGADLVLMAAKSWLCRDDMDRERLLDMEERLGPVRRASIGVIALALFACGPWLGWWTLIPLALAAGAFQIAERRTLAGREARVPAVRRVDPQRDRHRRRGRADRRHRDRRRWPGSRSPWSP